MFQIRQEYPSIFSWGRPIRWYFEVLMTSLQNSWENPETQLKCIPILRYVDFVKLYLRNTLQKYIYRMRWTDVLRTSWEFHNCSANHLTGFYMMRTLVVKGLIILFLVLNLTILTANWLSNLLVNQLVNLSTKFCCSLTWDNTKLFVTVEPSHCEIHVSFLFFLHFLVFQNSFGPNPIFICLIAPKNKMKLCFKY